MVMAKPEKYDPAHKGRLFRMLRRAVLAAQLKVTPGEQLARETSPTVRRLAGMKLP